MKKGQNLLFLHSNKISIQLSFLALLGLVCGCNGITGIDDIEFEGTDSVTTTDNATTTDNTISSDSTTSTASTTTIDTNSDSTVDSDSATNNISSTDSNIYVDTATTTSEQNTDTTTWDCGSGIEMDRNCNANGDAQRIDDCGDVIETIQCAETNGICFGGRCGCEDGWTGENCDTCVVYVNNKLNDFTSNGGRSWEQAVETMQSGIAIAEALGCDVWVSAGTYYPTEATDSADDRTMTLLLAEGVGVYGGFAGNETMIDKRNVAANETVLSGDLGLPNDTSDNAYHVVMGANDAVIDGFTITKGNADGTDSHNLGGGMYNYQTSPTVSNCFFSNNYAKSGGGMRNEYSADPIVSNCTFSNNHAEWTGGGISNAYNAAQVIDCDFIKNSALRDGGAISNGMSAGTYIANCYFFDNTATENGGALYNGQVAPALSISNCLFVKNQAEQFFGGAICNSMASPAITNCTIAENTAATGGGIYFGNQSTSAITNTIIWGNNATDTGDNLAFTDSTTYPANPTIEYSVVEGGYDGAENLNKDPLFANAAINDFYLLAESPCINRGNTIASPADIHDMDGDGDMGERIPFDLDGNPRFVGDSVDIGAYEFQY